MDEKKIGWQTYQDLIEKQINSPMLNMLLDNLSNKITSDLVGEGDEEYTDESQQEPLIDTSATLPISDQLIEDMAMLSNYDCWIGHCNFDITEDIKDQLDETPGIEVLKVISRYRFFIGVGKMFEFKNVRKHIEKVILNKEED